MKEAVLETLEKRGLYDALSCFEKLADKRQLVKLKVAFANEVKHLMPEASKSAFEVVERYAKGLATDEELDKASAAAARASAAADAAANDAGTHLDADIANDVDAARAERAANAAAYAAYAAYAVYSVDAAYASDAAAYDDDAAVRKERKAKQVEILKQFLGDAE